MYYNILYECSNPHTTCVLYSGEYYRCMFYFSELQGKDVYTEEKVRFGKTTDFYFRDEDIPLVTGMVVEKEDHTSVTIPASSIRKVNAKIVINQAFTPLSPNKKEVSISKHLLDKQVIDLVGNKVVRVNDIALQDKPYLCISGIDISMWGVLRRLGIADRLFNVFYRLKSDVHIRLLSWSDIQNLELEQGQIQLKKRKEKLERILAEDLADYLEMTTTRNIHRFLGTLEEKKAAEVVGNLNLNFQTALFQEIKPTHAARLLGLIDPDEAADILLTLPSRRRETILALLSEEKQEELKHLLRLSTTPTGNLLTTEFITVSSNARTRDIINKIRKETADFSFVSTVHVLNDNQQLVGLFSIHELLLQKADTPSYRFMTQNPAVIHLTTPIEIVAKKLFRYKLSSLPVIDNHKRMLGMVTVDDISEYVLGKIT